MVHASGYVLAEILETEIIRPPLRLLHQPHHLFTRTVCWSSIYNCYYKTIGWVQSRPNTLFGQLFQAQNLIELSEVANPSQQRWYYQGQKLVWAKAACILQVCCLCFPSFCYMDWLGCPKLREKPEFTGKQGMSKTVLGIVRSQGPPGSAWPSIGFKTCTVTVQQDDLSIVFPQYVAPEAIDSDVELPSLNNFLTCPF